MSVLKAILTLPLIATLIGGAVSSQETRRYNTAFQTLKILCWSCTFDFREDRDLVGQGIGLGIGLFECFISGRWQWKWFPCDPLETAEGWTVEIFLNLIPDNHHMNCVVVH